MRRNLYETRGRAAISRLLARERRYLSAHEVHRLLDQERAAISLSTVYRTLELLESRGDVSSRTGEDGESAFVSCGGAHHHHAICRACGLVEDVDCAAMEGFSAALDRHHGFELGDHALEFFGRCRRCR